MSNSGDIKKLSRNLTSADSDGSGKYVVTPGLFADLLVFQTSLHAFHAHLNLQKELNTVSSDHLDHYKKGLHLYKYYRVEYTDGYPLLKGLSDKMNLELPYNKAAEPVGNVETHLKLRSIFLDLFLRKSRSHIQDLRDIFQSKAYRTISDLIKALDNAMPFDIIKACDAITPASKNRMVWKWIDETRTLLGGTGSVEKTLSTLQTASDLGKELAQVNVQLTSQEPGTEAHDALGDKKQDLLEQVQALPAEALPVVAAASANKDVKYATKTGKNLSLSPAQEEAMMETGKVVIAAGAGSGKTKVLAGKVVYSIKELGLEPYQIMATSFTRKAAAELKDRIEKYGADLTDRVVQEGFGTTHSIATKLVLKYAPKMANFLKGYEQSDILKMAIAQIQMDHPNGKAPKPINRDIFNSVSSDPMAEYREAVASAIGYFTWMSNQPWVKNLSWVKENLSILEKAKTLDPKDLNPRQKQTLNEILDKVKGSNPPTYRVSSIIPVTKTADGDSVYWSRPAGQWFNVGFKFEKDDDYSPGEFEMYISNSKGRLISPSEAYELDPDSPFPAVYGAYEWLKSPDGEPAYVGRSDFDDVLLNATKVLLNYPRARQEVQSRYKCVLVDESQDLNSSQHLFFGLIAGHMDPKTRKPRTDGKMTADTYAFIGDDFQAIYSFRGAEPNEFINLSDANGGDFKTARH